MTCRVASLALPASSPTHTVDGYIRSLMLKASHARPAVVAPYNTFHLNSPGPPPGTCTAASEQMDVH
eukprot:1154524-Pelagomonas_calceolata.AAC.3